MENSFKSIIDKARSILILLPKGPYFDQVAAGLSLYLGLRDSKDVQISSPTQMTVEFNRLIGVNKINQELGSKNLIIRFSDYKANDIERVSYDIEDGQFKLTVIPKSRINPPSKDQVELSYSGVSADMVILIGGANESHFPALSAKELSGVRIAHIGTRDISLSQDKSVMSFARPASSVSEIVAGLMKESGMSIDSDVASNLLMGIEDGSSSFSVPEMNAETFALISELMKAGGKRIDATEQRQSYPPGSIPQQPVQQSRMQQPQAQQQKPQILSQKQTQNTGGTDQYTQNERQDQEADEGQDEAPKEWFEPKIFKGTSIK
jgi:hypothetical protein